MSEFKRVAASIAVAGLTTLSAPSKAADITLALGPINSSQSINYTANTPGNIVSYPAGSSATVVTTGLTATGPAPISQFTLDATFTLARAFTFTANGESDFNDSVSLTLDKGTTLLASANNNSFTGGPAIISGLTVGPGTYTLEAVDAIPSNGFGITSGTVNAGLTPSAATPEPAGWAMLLTGVGAIGGMMRRNRARHYTPA